MLLIHLDADDSDITDALQHKVEPANAALAEIGAYLAPVYLIPVQETEAWLLADLPELRRNFRTNLSNQNLGWTFQNPESLADPKKSIKAAIDIVNQGRRRNQTVDLAKLYGPLGSSIDLNELRKLSSFQRFETDYQGALENILR